MWFSLIESFYIVIFNSCIYIDIKLNLYIKVEEAMAPHSSALAWKIPWTEEPCRLQSMGSLRVRYD